MTTKEAVAQRIIDLCNERNIAINALANISGAGVVSIKKICDGLEITVREFFDDPLFDSTEQEIK